MSQNGLGFMIQALSGRSQEEVDRYTSAIGKIITHAALENDTVKLAFEDGSTLGFYDDAQSCCERRYMSTDDDVSSLVGRVFKGIEIKDAPSISAEYEEHDVQFLEVVTDRHRVVFANHNEHNGYYGGFYIRVITF